MKNPFLLGNVLYMKKHKWYVFQFLHYCWHTSLCLLDGTRTIRRRTIRRGQFVAWTIRCLTIRRKTIRRIVIIQLYFIPASTMKCLNSIKFETLILQL
jgi:hypothetical protein